ncbi:MAG: hypothetical protein ACLUAR_09845 [Pilosibacter sp.]
MVFFDTRSGSSGAMLTGWQWIDGKCYYLDPAAGGAMTISNTLLDGSRVGSDGAWVDGSGNAVYQAGKGIPGSGNTVNFNTNTNTSQNQSSDTSKKSKRPAWWDNENLTEVQKVAYSGSVVKTKIQAFYNEPISVAELGRCPR